MKPIASPKLRAVKTKKPGITKQAAESFLTFWPAWLAFRVSKLRRKQSGFEVPTRFADIVGFQDCRDHADSPGASGQHGVEVFQIDTPDGEPRDSHIRGRPSDIIECDGFGGRLCAGGVNRADGNVIGTRGDGAFRLGGGVRA